MITLTSDFGLRDPYVAEMKGVILSINPGATLIDVTHQIEKFNIRAAAFALASAAPFFPDGTVHLAVVDPEVGTNRRAIMIQTKKAFFVGPDNGVLVLAAQSQGIKHAYQLANPKFMMPKISSTFHGRDIFAPAAAYLSKGLEPSGFGPEIKNPVTPTFGQTKLENGYVMGEVLDVDGFGNVVTNISGKDAEGREGETFNVEITGATLKIPFRKAYAQAKAQEPVIMVGSHGFLEIAFNQSSAAKKFRLKAGDKIKVAVG